MSFLCASRVFLVTSTGSPHCSGLPPPLSSMNTLPDAAEIYQIYRPCLQAISVVYPPVFLLCNLIAFPPTHLRWARGRFMSICIVTLPPLRPTHSRSCHVGFHSLSRGNSHHRHPPHLQSSPSRRCSTGTMGDRSGGGCPRPGHISSRPVSRQLLSGFSSHLLE